MLKTRDPDTRKYKEFLFRHGLSNIITSPTHYRENMTESSLIDLFITTDEELYSQHGVCPTMVSDHYIIFGARKKFKVKSNKTHLLACRYKGLNENGLVEDLSMADWTSVTNATDPSVAWDKLVSIFIGILDLHAPYKYMYFGNNLPEWVTRELLAEIKYRESLANKADKTKNPVDIIAAKRKRNYVTGLKRNLKRTYFTRAINEAKNDPKKLWRILQSLVGSGKSKTCITSLNGKTESTDMANELNRFFSDIGPNLAAKIPESMLVPDYTFDNSRPVFVFTPCDAEEVEKLLMKIPSNKSTGLHGVPIKFLKMVPDIICPLLVHIINLSLTTCTVPSQWKAACLTPLHKEGD